MGFTIFNYGWWDVPDYNPYYDEMMLSKDKNERNQWIEKAKSGEWYRINRAAAESDLEWRQEFEGAFDANKGNAFAARSIERVFARNYLEERSDPEGVISEWWTSEKKENRLYVTGCDLGQKNDSTVFVTYDITDYDPNDRDELGRFNPKSRAILVDYKYIEPGSAEWSEIEAAGRRHYLHWMPDAQHDGTGAGASYSEAMDQYSDEFIFTKNSKELIVNNIKHAFDYGAVKLPKIPRLFREHQRYIWEDKDIVQDTVMANGLAIDLFHTAGSGMVTGFTRVPFMAGANA